MHNVSLFQTGSERVLFFLPAIGWSWFLGDALQRLLR